MKLDLEGSVTSLLPLYSISYNYIIAGLYSKEG